MWQYLLCSTIYRLEDAPTISILLLEQPLLSSLTIHEDTIGGLVVRYWQRVDQICFHWVYP